jgi:ActR/RegA family two-component response regulator
VSSPSRTPREVFLLSDDLVFASRVAGQAEARGAGCLRIPTVRDLEALLCRRTPDLVIVDLALAGPDLGRLVDAVRRGRLNSPRIVAYGPHVDAELLRDARQLGCDVVLPRSKFVEELPAALGGWLGATGQNPPSQSPSEPEA